MEHEGPLPCSQVPTIGPYPEPFYFNPHPRTLLLKYTFLIFSSHLWLALPSRLFISGFVILILISRLSRACVLHAYPIILDLIDPNNIYKNNKFWSSLMRNVLHSPLPFSWVQILSQHSAEPCNRYENYKDLYDMIKARISYSYNPVRPIWT
jgi:hypothetical protein